MKYRIIKNDLKRNKMKAVTLFAVIILAEMLVSGSVNIILTLFGGMDTLLEKSNVAHFAQLHSGAINQEELDSFAYENSELIKAQQMVELLGMDGRSIYIGDR